MADFRSLRNVKLGNHVFCITSIVPVDIGGGVAVPPNVARTTGKVMEFDRNDAMSFGEVACFEGSDQYFASCDLLLLNHRAALRDVNRDVEIFLATTDARASDRCRLSRITSNRDPHMVVGWAHTL